MERYPDVHRGSLVTLDAAREPHKNNVLLPGFWCGIEPSSQHHSYSPLWDCGLGLRNAGFIRCLDVCALSADEVAAQAVNDDFAVFVARLVV